MERYEQIYINNYKMFSLLERAAWASTFLLLDRFDENELKSTLMNSVIDNVVTYHDYLWQKYSHLSKKFHLNIEEKTKLELEKTAFFPEANMKISLILSFIYNSELLLEILTDTFHSQLQGMVILTIELLKVLLRLRLLWINGGGIVARDKIPSRDKNLDKKENENEVDQLEEMNNQHYADGRKKRPNLLLLLRSLKKSKEMITERDINHSTAPDFYIILGELLWIFKPLIYLYQLHKHGKDSWTPWLMALLVELCRMGCIHKKKLNLIEKKEVNQRNIAVLLFVLRSPFYETLTNSALTNYMGNKLNVQGLSALMNMVTKLINIYRKRYFNIAGSK
uniref:Peroxisomal membrane protein PEX16 n=1 Tax=Arcella intermedia TaxID=1963864 RepID=A0A6B2L998_9EUKA